MSVIGKYQRKGYFIDPDTFKYRTKHKSGVKNGERSSELDYKVDKQSHLFHNDSVLAFDSDTDHDVYFGINKRAWDFDGDFDEFSYSIEDWEYDI